MEASARVTLAFRLRGYSPHSPYPHAILHLCHPGRRLRTPDVTDKLNSNRLGSGTVLLRSRRYPAHSFRTNLRIRLRHTVSRCNSAGTHSPHYIGRSQSTAVRLDMTHTIPRSRHYRSSSRCSFARSPGRSFRIYKCYLLDSYRTIPRSRLNRRFLRYSSAGRCFAVYTVPRNCMFGRSDMSHRIRRNRLHHSSFRCSSLCKRGVLALAATPSCRSPETA